MSVDASGYYVYACPQCRQMAYYTGMVVTSRYWFGLLYCCSSCSRTFDVQSTPQTNPYHVRYAALYEHKSEEPPFPGSR